MAERVTISQVMAAREAKGKPFDAGVARRILSENPDVMDDIGTFGDEDYTAGEPGLIDADPLGALAHGLSFGAVGNRPAGSFKEDPVGHIASLAGMLRTAGAGSGVLRAAAPGLNPAVNAAASLGGYSGLEAAGHGAGPLDVVKSTAVGGAMGAGLHALNALPGLQSVLGQAGVFSGLEAAGGGDIRDIAAAAVGGPLAVRLSGGAFSPLRSRGRSVPLLDIDPGMLHAREGLPPQLPGTEKPLALPLPAETPLLLPARASQRVTPERRPRTKAGKAEVAGTGGYTRQEGPPNAIQLGGSIAPVDIARMDARPWEMVPDISRVRLGNAVPLEGTPAQREAAQVRGTLRQASPDPLVNVPSDQAPFTRARRPGSRDDTVLLDRMEPVFDAPPERVDIDPRATGGVSYGEAVRRIQKGLGEPRSVAEEVAGRIQVVGRRGNGIMLDAGLVERASRGEFEGLPLAANKTVKDADDATTAAMLYRNMQWATAVRRSGGRGIPLDRAQTIGPDAAPHYVDALILGTGSPGNMRGYDNPGDMPKSLAIKTGKLPKARYGDKLPDYVPPKEPEGGLVRDAAWEKRMSGPVRVQLWNTDPAPKAEPAPKKPVPRRRATAADQRAEAEAAAQAERDRVSDEFLARVDADAAATAAPKQKVATAAPDAPGSPVANDLPAAKPITQGEAPAPQARSSRPLDGFEHLNGADYRDRATGDIYIKAGDQYVKASKEYAGAANRRNPQGGVFAGKTQTIATSQSKDVTLGAGLGGAQGLLGLAAKWEPPAKQSVRDNAVDSAAWRFRKSGDLDAWIADTAPDKIRLPEKFMDEIRGLKDIDPYEGQVGGRKYAIQKSGGGRLGSAPERHVLWANRNGEIAAIQGNARLKLRAVDILDKHGITDAKKAEDLYFRGTDLAHRGDKDVGELRQYLDWLREMANKGRAASGRDQIPHMDDYLPLLQKLTMSERFKESGAVADGTPQDWLRVAERFNPHAEHRDRRGGKKPNTDVRELLDVYIDNITKDIFYNPIIAQNKMFAKAMAEAGLTNSAQNILDYTDVVLGGRQSWVTRRVRGAPQPLRLLASDLPKAHRKLLTNAALLGNVAWSLGMQPFSAVNVVARSGFRSAAKAVPYAFMPGPRRYVQEQLRGGLEKRRELRGPAAQDIKAGGTTESFGASRVKPPTLRDGFDHWASWISHEVELASYTHGAMANYFDGVRRGFSGRKLAEWMNDGGSKAHGDYNYADRPGILQNKEVSAWFPFTQWWFDSLNGVRETVLGGESARTGHYAEYQPDGSALKRYSLRARHVARFLIAAALYEEFYSAPLFGRRPLRDMLFGETMGPAATLKSSLDLAEAVRKTIKYGTPDPLRKWTLRNLVPMGNQFNKVWDGVRAIENDGDVYNVDGRKAYNIGDGTVRLPGGTLAEVLDLPQVEVEAGETFERVRAVVGGPTITEGGQEKYGNYTDNPMYRAMMDIDNDRGGSRNRRPRRQSRPRRPSN